MRVRWFAGPSGVSLTRRRWRWPRLVTGRLPGPRRKAGGPPAESDTAPAWSGFGLAVAILAGLLLVSLILPTGLVAVEGPLDPHPLQTGEDLTYRLVVANHGRVPAWIRAVRLDLSAPLWTADAADAPADRPPAVAAGRRDVRVPVGAFLLPGEERTVALRIRVLEPGELVVRSVRIEFAQLLDPRTLQVETPALVATVNPSGSAVPVFAEQGQFGRSFEGRGFRLVRVEGGGDGDVSRLTFVFRAPRGAEGEPPGFVAARSPEGGIDLVVSGLVPPGALTVDGAPASLTGLRAAPTAEGDVRIRIGVRDLLEYRAYAAAAPPRIVVEWRSGAAGAVVYAVRVPRERADLAQAILRALEGTPSPLLPASAQREGDAWVVRFERRHAAERLARALEAAGVTVQLRVERLANPGG